MKLSVLRMKWAPFSSKSGRLDNESVLEQGDVAMADSLIWHFFLPLRLEFEEVEVIGDKLLPYSSGEPREFFLLLPPRLLSVFPAPSTDPERLLGDLPGFASGLRTQYELLPLWSF